MFKNNNNGEDGKKDLHVADNDYRHLNLPKHDNISIKEVIAQLQQQSSLQPASEDNASLYPFHIHLAQADTGVPGVPVEAPEASAEVKTVTEEIEVGVLTEEDEIIIEDDEPAAEDPGVLLLPSLSEEVVRIQVTRQIKVPDDDGSQDLHRLHLKNKGGVDSDPRDLGVPPVDYPLQKVEPTVLPQQTQAVEPVCCSYQVEIKLDFKLLYLGKYDCGCGCGNDYGYGDTQRGTGGYAAAYSSGYSWEGKGDWGGNSCCKPYEVPPEPVPNYSIVFNNCDGDQWLDLTICNSKGTPAIAAFADSGDCGCNGQYQSSYDDCCTTYRIEIPAEFGLDCDCELVLQTDQLFIESPWDLIYSENTHFVDCHGVCYELTVERKEENGSGTFITQQIDGYGECQPTFVLEPCECINEPVQISLVNSVCEGGGYTSGSTYYGDDYSFNFAFTSGDTNNIFNDGTYLTFTMNFEHFGLVTYIDLPPGFSCACPINELVFDESDFLEYVQQVTDYGSSSLTSQQVLNFFANNGFFEDCHDECYELNLGQSQGFEVYSVQACDDCEHEPIDITFSCDLVDRFNSWVMNVAPGSFDPFQFFTDNVSVEYVNCEGASFVEINYPYIGYEVDCGWYATENETIRIDIPNDLDICFDDFLQAVFDPKEIYEEFQDDCFTAGYDISDVVYEALNSSELYFRNWKTGDEYEVNWNSCTGSYVLEPASCSEDICIDLVNSPCQEEEEERLEANFQNGDYGCCGSECQTTYSYSTECANVEFQLTFYSGAPYGDPYVEFYYYIDNYYSQVYENSVTIDGSSLAALGCTNPLESFVFDESDFIAYLESICNTYNSGSSSEITGQQVLDFFSSNGMFEDCEGNCYEIDTQVNGSAPVSYTLADCDDCTDTPIAVSIDDCCVTEQVPGLVDAEADNGYGGDTDADKLAFFSNLYNLEYVNCNGASFVEFTYYCNNSCEEACKYNSFPPCEQTIRITVPEVAYGYGCEANGSGPITYNISEILPSNDDLSSLINSLILDCDFITDFFDPQFSDYCGDISYNIPCDWGTDFLNYLLQSDSKFTTDSGICYEVAQNDCGDYVLDLGFDPLVLHDTGAVSSSVYEATFLVVDCDDCCDEVPTEVIQEGIGIQGVEADQPFLLGLALDNDYIMGNEVFVGEKIVLPPEYGCDCIIDPCSFNLIYEDYGSGISHVEGFTFDVSCDGKDYDYVWTVDDGWTVTPCCENVPVTLIGTDIGGVVLSGFGISNDVVSYGSELFGTYNSVVTNNSTIENQSFINDLRYEFTYTHCDVDHDGDTDSFFNFLFDNYFVEEENGSTYVTDLPPTTLVVDASVANGECCDFTLTYDESYFGNTIFNLINDMPDTIIDSQLVLDTLIGSSAIFSDCEGNQFIINNNAGNYSLQAYQAVDPVVLDLSANGIQLTDAANGVQYDMNNDGVKDQSAWIGSGNGLLVYDADQNNTVTNASEFILTEHVPGAKTDLEALRIGFDSNHDDVFDQKDAAWNLFGIWQDANKDAVVDNGEYHSLSQMGIASIGLVADADSQSVQSGNTIHGLSEFTRTDGSTGVVADVSLRYQDVVENDSLANAVGANDSSHNCGCGGQAAPAAVPAPDAMVQTALDQAQQQSAVASA